MAITSSGLGSGLDINGIISQLMLVEQQPITALNTKEVTLQSKITALGSLKSSLSQFQTKVKALTDPSKFNQITSSISDSTYATVSTSSKAQVGRFSLEVSQLAQANKIKTGVFSKTTDVVGTGKLTIQLGTYANGSFSPNADQTTMSVTIDSSKNTLAGVRDAINAANGGVTAAIVNDGSGNRLVLSSKDTGVANSIKITTEDNDLNNTDTTGLSQLAYDPAAASGAGKNLTELQAAKNALLKVDGLDVSKSSNVISDAVEGVTLSLSKVTTTALSVNVSRSSADITTAVQDLVKEYNTLASSMADLGHFNYNASTKVKDAGTLQGERALRSVQTELRSVLTGSLGTSNTYTRLSDVGITFNKDGTLALDSTKLSTAISNDYQKVASLFAANATPTDSKVSYVSAKDDTKAGTYGINITQLATKGSLNSSAVSTPYTYINTSNASIGVSLGSSTASINLDSGSYADTTAMAAQIKSKIEANGSLYTAGDTVSVAYNASTDKFDISRTSGTTTDTTSVGLSLKPFQVDSNSDTFKLKVDGVQTDTITLTTGNYSGKDLAAELQSRINGDSTLKKNSVSVSVNWNSTTNKFEFSSNRYGSASKMEVTSLDTNTSNLLGIAAGPGTNGVDVAGTVGGLHATGNGQSLTVSEGDAIGLKLNIDGTTTGDRGSITFNRGFAYQLDKVLDKAISSTGAIATRVDSLNSNIKTISKDRDKLTQRLTDTEARYRKQYTALDVLVGQLKQTSTYLTTQLANLVKTSSS